MNRDDTVPLLGGVSHAKRVPGRYCAALALDPSSRSRLTPQQAARFVGDGLFERVARALCAAGKLPRKELYEAWAVARKVRRRLGGAGGRVVDLCAGHGLLGQLLLLLDRAATAAVCVDAAVPPSAALVAGVLAEAFPAELGAGRVTRVEAAVADFELGPGDLVVALHACGELTDLVLARAAAARARVAVLPCCHDLGSGNQGGLEGWIEDGPLAVDLTRAAWLRGQGYQVWTARIDAAVTPKNRLLMGAWGHV